MVECAYNLIDWETDKEDNGVEANLGYVTTLRPVYVTQKDLVSK